MRVAALDLGSNTTLMLIADVQGNTVTPLYDGSTVTKMGQGVQQNRRFHPDALARIDACLAQYAEKIREWNCEKVIAVATSAARDVENGEALLALGQKHQIPITIIDGRREAELTFQGSVSDRKVHEGIGVIDVGGGSTELIVQSNSKPHGHSVNVGSVRLTEMFITNHPVAETEMARLRAHCEKAFMESRSLAHKVREVIAVAGTPTTLAALEHQKDYDEKLVHGFRLSRECIERWITKLAAMTIEEREHLPGMQPKRSEVIVAGSIILSSAMQALGVNEVVVSTRGVRYGVALAWQSF